MTRITQDQRDAIQATGWTEAEVTGFAQALAAFRDGLPPRQRDAFNQILTTAGAAASEDDVQGHLVVHALIMPPFPGLLVPASDTGWKTSVPGSVPPRRG